MFEEAGNIDGDGGPLRDKHLLGAALGDLGTWSTWLTTLKVGPGVVPHSSQNKNLDQGAGIKAPLTHKMNFKGFPLKTPPLLRKSDGREAESGAMPSVCFVDS